MTDEEIAKEAWRNDDAICTEDIATEKIYERGFLAGLKVGRLKWHKLDWEEDYPDVDKLIRVRTYSGDEYICETYSYQPTEDEIGYGNIITQFSELNGDWVDDNEVEYWCEIPRYTEN